jgi:hypothetical protein
MGIRQAIEVVISKWLAKEHGAGAAIGDAISDWLANQPGIAPIELPLRCTSCSYQWTYRADLTKTKLPEAVKSAMKCPICGTQPARLNRGNFPK